MAVIVKYAHPEVGGQYLCINQSHPNGYWRSGQRGGAEAAFPFNHEGEAKDFLVQYRYDLPPLKVSFPDASAPAALSWERLDV